MRSIASSEISAADIMLIQAWSSTSYSGDSMSDARSALARTPLGFSFFAISLKNFARSLSSRMN
ncbi:hypothetical protein HSBAA_12130 [Vreelandella sulfidaeris]|uniref:Uncharacterized protein n=1 Tax=Vreelandella sulfidaeris TaxID=115553 RepID=A0A455U2N5_9GAMM|nr:hypothetical protein HSBAA_12130 [Halomonas sulfidaeris]